MGIGTFTRWLVLLGALLLTAIAMAEQSKQLGNWDVHYSAFGSTFLSPEIASSYQLHRSRYIGLINISVLDASQDNKPAQAVTISGTAKNLLGTIHKLTFREIREGEAIYYIAEVPHRNEETFNFDIRIDNDDKSETMAFTHTFYVD